jgi:GDP/UDP-N,N'-diacetylbacillosamine 2-epimerase (hydrolysing)
MTICVITGSRADYGLLKWLMEEINQSSVLNLRVIASAMHLSPHFGNTINEIEKDGFKVDWKVDMLLSSDKSVAVSQSMGLGIIGFSNAFEHIKPDAILLLGDRFEALAAANAAMFFRIPIIHIHGGESTPGMMDEAIRHSLTKFSHLHFVATEQYRNRVLQLGEEPKRVFCVGGMGIEAISRVSLLSKNVLEKNLKFKFEKRNLLLTYHPVTLKQDSAGTDINEILAVLEEYKDINLLFTMPNADMEGYTIYNAINKFVSQFPSRAKSINSMGQLNYLSCMQFVDGVLGNSSSGILEAPSFKIGTINIGDRQKGRIMAKSVINCKIDRSSIKQSIEQLYSDEFKKMISCVVNPYYKYDYPSKEIVKILERSPGGLTSILFKEFVDFQN